MTNIDQCVTNNQCILVILAKQLFLVTCALFQLTFFHVFLYTFNWKHAAFLPVFLHGKIRMSWFLPYRFLIF